MSDEAIPLVVREDEAPDALAPVELHQRETNTPDWLHAATLRRTRWGIGREVTRAAYEAEVKKTANHPCGV